VVNKKRIFIAFTVGDEQRRDSLKGQTLPTKSPFDFIDISTNEVYEIDWKERVRTSIRGSAGVIALISKRSRNSTGLQWELSCAREEGKRILVIWAYDDDLSCLGSVNTMAWTGDTIRNFIDSV
jgi:hypothetical protein